MTIKQQAAKRERPVKQHPRLLEAGETLFMVKRLWPSLEFDFRATKHGAEFIFCLPPPLPNELNRNLDRAIFRTLFVQSGEDWKRNVKEALATLKLDGRPMMRRTRNMLYRVFREAFRLYLEENPQLFKKGARKWLRDQLASLQQYGPRKRGPQFSEPQRQERAEKKNALAVELAQTYNELLPRIKRLRASIITLKKSGNFDETIARKAVEATLSNKWAEYVLSREAFKRVNLFDFSTNSHVDGALEEPKWTARELTLSLVLCEQRKAGAHLSPTTLYEKYIQAGRKWLRDRRGHPVTS